MSRTGEERKKKIQSIKKDIDNTWANYEFADDMIDSLDNDEKYEKMNKNRLDALHSKIEDLNGRVLD